jgi:hypothetical protein
MRLAIISATLSCALSFVAGQAFAAPMADDDAIKDALVKLETASWVAWKGHDGAFFDSFLSDDHVEIHPNGAVGKADVVKSVAQPICTVASYNLGPMQFTRVSTDVAVLVYYAEQDTKCGKFQVPSPVWATSLYARRDGRWVNVLYQHTAAVKPK